MKTYLTHCTWSLDLYFFFFDNAGLYALHISICSNNSRGEPESNPGVPGQQRISPPLGYPIVLYQNIILVLLIDNLWLVILVLFYNLWLLAYELN